MARRSRRSRSRTRSRNPQTGGKYSDLVELVAAGVYGAVRAPLANVAVPITNKMQNVTGNISDEVLLGGSAYLINLFFGKKSRLVRQAMKPIYLIEGARIGEAVATGTTGIGSNQSVPQNTW